VVALFGNAFHAESRVMTGCDYLEQMAGQCPLRHTDLRAKSQEKIHGHHHGL
jgi:hypothetical protein